MAWIKRNLIFVISAIIGLGLIGWAGYYLFDNLQTNATLKDSFDQKVHDLKELQGKNPSPTQENVDALRAQQAELRSFLSDVRKSFVPLPKPPKTDERGFALYLAKAIADLQGSASSYGIGIPENYSFSFSSLHSEHGERVSFAQSSIEPWLMQLQEIQTICGLLFDSKINFLEGLRRVPVSQDDQGGPDYLSGASINTNDLYITTPYEVTFRAFSPEIAEVLQRFSQSSNCFVVKNIDVQPSRAAAPTTAAVAPPAPVFTGRGSNPATLPTFINEKPLHVTMWVEAVKLKTP